MTDDQKTIYALGLSIYRSIGQFNLSPAELAIVEKALSDAAAGKPAVSLDQWGPKIQGFAQARVTQAAAAYVGKAEDELGAGRRPSGLL